MLELIVKLFASFVGWGIGYAMFRLSQKDNGLVVFSAYKQLLIPLFFSVIIEHFTGVPAVLLMVLFGCWILHQIKRRCDQRKEEYQREKR